MKVFYGAAIQGCDNKDEWISTHRALINEIKNAGHLVIAEHTASNSIEEKTKLLEEAFGPLPPPGRERTVQIRNAIVRRIAGDIGAAVFEASVPSLGTGIEIAHAYLRPKMGQPEIPVLVLYKKDYWQYGLSTMVRGITPEEVPGFEIREYEHIDEAKMIVREFLRR